MDSSTFLEPLIKIVVLIAIIMTAAAYLVLLERKMAAWIQDRRGPNRVGAPLSLFGWTESEATDTTAPRPSVRLL